MPLRGSAVTLSVLRQHFACRESCSVVVQLVRVFDRSSRCCELHAWLQGDRDTGVQSRLHRAGRFAAAGGRPEVRPEPNPDLRGKCLRGKHACSTLLVLHREGLVLPAQGLVVEAA
jgi:hypothetical protein